MIVVVVVTLAVGLALQPLVIRVLRRGGVLDRPSARSSHSVPTVRGGGVAMVVALLVGVAVGGALHDRQVALAALTIALCALVGLAEDVRGVPVLPRFGLLLLACAPVALLAAGRGTAVGVLAVLAALVLGVSVVNAVNFMDGINGISAAQGVGGGVVLAGVALAHAEPAIAVLGVATAAAAASFAPFNVPRARVFLGDTGSYGLGGALFGLCLLLLTRGVQPEAALAPLAVYLADTGSTLARRVARGESWHQPHRTHVYQRLTDCGLSHVQVSGAVLGLVVTSGLLGAAALGTVSERLAADACLAVVLAAYLHAPRLLGRAGLAAARVRAVGA